ncbi:hypothetical protein PENTCL1PPCAC_9107 [Pristionchus entomophagus]|uniref:Uncharacterized protein n=1 Tax=Pristionchus entomophagus TaxID=358040 RepID=A0AAV5SW08_9BILA|nr:hypothetical protein PENTCL1PPCAC_9107 [Pristionchus entomophagus]
MANAEDTLNFKEIDVLPNHTLAYQTDDGTIFHHKTDAPQRLYVGWLGKRPQARLPHPEITTIAAYENAVYICANRKIYRVTFTPPATIIVVFVRDVFEDSQVFRMGLCSRVLRNGTMTAYRMWEHFNDDGVVVDVEEGSLTGLTLVGIHRGKAFYAKTNCGGVITIRQLCDNVYEINLPQSVRPNLLIRDAWNMIYIENDRTLFILDSNTMEFLPPLRIQGADIACVPTGIRNGEMYAMCRGAVTWYYMIAKLPEIYLPH